MNCQIRPMTIAFLSGRLRHLVAMQRHIYG